MTDKKAIFIRVIMISSLVIVAAVAIFIQLIFVQVEFSDAIAFNDPAVAMIDIPSPRGNIYDVNGNLLAISMPVYTIAIDATQPSDTLFENNYLKLADGLSGIFSDVPSSEFSKKLRHARRDKKQYLKLQSGVRFSELQLVKTLPILKEGRYDGGFVYTQQTKRMQPFGHLCERTIGYAREKSDVGIEKAYNHYLKGQDGKRLMQKINGGIWKPINNTQDVEPVVGSDVYSTIDIRIQDIAQTALLRSLEKYEAENGSVILMDVKTGAIRAMSSLERTSEGKYAENFNYAIGAAYEPGSTFKLASLLIALEDGVVDTSYVVDTKNGAFKFYDRTMKDSNYHRGGHGKISVGRAFEVSSNIGIARTIVNHYGDDPQRFIDRLARLGVSDKLDFELIGEAEPWIKNTNDSTWSGVSLPWMAFGYEIKMSALQILALYNAVANDGELVKPRLVDKVKRAEKIIESYDVEVLNPSICSEKTIQILQNLLIGAVKKGTAQNIYSEKYSSAGKTGTAKIALEGSYGSEYRASFAGYFPAENPKYSCMVVVSKPKKEIGFYGNIVAAPVFKELRDNLFAEEAIEIPEIAKTFDHYYIGSSKDLNAIHDLLDYPKYQASQNERWLKSDDKAFQTLEFIGDVVPNVKGMVAMDALYLLENMGLEVNLKGQGRVIKQSLKAGAKIKENQIIELILSS
ncbi:MAG: penicillin-binding protein [Cryomorphaceae bacterium]|nr:MAG: penicillin-binding protein [Cryomorphaceae bacterium]